MSRESTIPIEHRRFGRIEVPAEDAIHFDPLPGFPAARRFALLAHDREAAYGWLVSLAVPDLAFVVTDPRQFFPDYEPEIGERQRRRVDAKESDEVAVLAMVTLRSGVATLNLLAPLVLCVAARRGMQLILDDARYPTAQPLPPLQPAAPPEATAAQTESKPQT